MERLEFYQHLELRSAERPCTTTECVPFFVSPSVALEGQRFSHLETAPSRSFRLNMDQKFQRDVDTKGNTDYNHSNASTEFDDEAYGY